MLAPNPLAPAAPTEKKKKLTPNPNFSVQPHFLLYSLTPHGLKSRVQLSVPHGVWCQNTVSPQQIFVKQERNTIRCQIGTMANAKIHEEGAS